MADFNLASVRRLHVIGVGGAGMSALAKLLSQGGVTVSGSDLRGGIELAALADIGVNTWSGHHPERIGDVDLVVASSAVPDDDPELVASVRRGLPLWRRPELLAELTAMIPTIGPTGTHGKTTTTALLILGARAAGMDPSFVVGGELVDLATNAHRGTDPLLVLEVDEAFGTFERLSLDGLIVTSVEPEHLDYFGSSERMEATYCEVASRVNGPVVCCVDDPGAVRVKEAASAIGYGLAEGADWRIIDLQERPASVDFVLHGGADAIDVSIPRPGKHVAANAAGAIALLAELGHDPHRVTRGMGNFKGVRRRFEHRGTVAGVTMVDDYAHHPTEVGATLLAARAAGHSRLWAVFQPHLYSRTELLHRQFGEALATADRVVVTDIYAAREAPIPGVTGEMVAAAAASVGAEVLYIPHRADLAAVLAENVIAGDLVVTMGAGDITLVPTELAALLAARSSS
jgi:UDP-N-acetylmuramate--alanine ligase